LYFAITGGLSPEGFKHLSALASPSGW